jgi:hypothetical protein
MAQWGSLAWILAKKFLRPAQFVASANKMFRHFVGMHGAIC